MGISGLLPVLKSITQPKHVREYRGQRVAIDGFSWLHKGAYCCSGDLVQGVYTDKFVMYCMSRIEMLLHNGVIPVVVFDGGRLPTKADEEEIRRSSRKDNKEKGFAHLAAGNSAAAEECFQRAVTVTSRMAKQWIEALKDREVDFLVSPYEADAQMAYLAINGNVHAVITEDSDLLVYGCPRVLYKLDKVGHGEEILTDRLAENQSVSFVGFNHDMFVATCIMAGCDFLPSLPNIGFKKAHKHMKKYRDFVKVCKNLRFSGTNVPREYEESFQRALWVFRHQRVYCPEAKAVVHVRPLPPGGLGAQNVDVMSAVPAGEGATALDFLGPMLPDHIAQGIAEGHLDASTGQPFDLELLYRGCSRMPKGVAAQLHHSGVASCRSNQVSSQPEQRAGKAADASVRVATSHDLAPGSGRAQTGGSNASGQAKTSGASHGIQSFFSPRGPAYAAFAPPRKATPAASPMGQSTLPAPGGRPAPSALPKRKRLGMTCALKQQVLYPAASAWIAKGPGTAKGAANPFAKSLSPEEEPGGHTKAAAKRHQAQHPARHPLQTRRPDFRSMEAAAADDHADTAAADPPRPSRPGAVPAANETRGPHLQGPQSCELLEGPSALKDLLRGHADLRLDLDSRFPVSQGDQVGDVAGARGGSWPQLHSVLGSQPDGQQHGPWEGSQQWQGLSLADGGGLVDSGQLSGASMGGGGRPLSAMAALSSGQGRSQSWLSRPLSAGQLMDGAASSLMTFDGYGQPFQQPVDEIIFGRQEAGVAAGRRVVRHASMDGLGHGMGLGNELGRDASYCQPVSVDLTLESFPDPATSPLDLHQRHLSTGLALPPAELAACISSKTSNCFTDVPRPEPASGQRLADRRVGAAGSLPGVKGSTRKATLQETLCRMRSSLSPLLQQQGTRGSAGADEPGPSDAAGAPGGTIGRRVETMGKPGLFGLFAARKQDQKQQEGYQDVSRPQQRARDLADPRHRSLRESPPLMQGHEEECASGDENQGSEEAAVEPASGFHGIEHIKRYPQVASDSLDRIQRNSSHISRFGCTAGQARQAGVAIGSGERRKINNVLCSAGHGGSGQGHASRVEPTGARKPFRLNRLMKGGANDPSHQVYDFNIFAMSK